MGASGAVVPLTDEQMAAREKLLPSQTPAVKPLSDEEMAARESSMAGQQLLGSTPRLRAMTGAAEPPTIAQRVAPYLPMAGGAVGGFAGPVGAVAGGMGGEAANLAIQAANNPNSPPPDVGTALNIGLEGLKQGAYELGGRAIAAGGGALLAKLRGIQAPTVGTTIKGTTLPETVGQSSGNPLAQKLEGYLSGSWLGGPLRALKHAQEAGSREIMAKLSGVGMYNPAELSGNWAQAREATRALAVPMYESLKGIDAPAVNKVAQDLLGDQALRLSSKAKQALGVVGEDPAEGLAQALGYTSAKQANQKMGSAAFQSVMQKMGISAKTANVGDSLAARHELSDMAAHATDPNDARLLRDAASKLDGAIEASLTPQQQAVKDQADLLWRRSYIMDKIQKGLGKMEDIQDPNAAPSVIANSFVKMVNKLARNPIGRDSAGSIINRPSELDILFDNPADRKAMTDLASFLATKGSALGGPSGIESSLANIGTAVAAMHLPVSIAEGRIGAAARSGAYLAGLFGASKILANPGGARALQLYFASPQAAQVALAGRILALSEGQK